MLGAPYLAVESDANLNLLKLEDQSFFSANIRGEYAFIHTCASDTEKADF